MGKTRSGKEYGITPIKVSNDTIYQYKVPPLIHPDLIKSEPPKYLSRFADSGNTTPTTAIEQTEN